MPCLGPLTLRQQLRLIRSLAAANARATLADTRVRRLGKWTGAVMAGLLLIQPSALHHDPMGSPETLPELPPPDVALLAATAEPEDAACPDVEADLSTVDMGPDAGMSRPRYRMPDSEEGMPKHWRRAPCPEGESVRVVHRTCFNALKETPRGTPPTCAQGVPYMAECLQPMPVVKALPSSIGQ